MPFNICIFFFPDRHLLPLYITVYNVYNSFVDVLMKFGINIPHAGLIMHYFSISRALMFMHNKMLSARAHPSQGLNPFDLDSDSSMFVVNFFFSGVIYERPR